MPFGLFDIKVYPSTAKEATRVYNEVEEHRIEKKNTRAKHVCDICRKVALVLQHKNCQMYPENTLALYQYDVISLLSESQNLCYPIKRPFDTKCMIPYWKYSKNAVFFF